MPWAKGGSDRREGLTIRVLQATRVYRNGKPQKVLSKEVTNLIIGLKKIPLALCIEMIGGREARTKEGAISEVKTGADSGLSWALQ